MGHRIRQHLVLMSCTVQADHVTELADTPVRPTTRTPRTAPAWGVDAALLGVAVVWGSSYLAAKTVATPATVPGFLSLRFAVAVACLALPLLPRLRRTTALELRLGATYGAVLSAIFALETYGVIGTTASNAGLIISLTMLMTPWLEGRLRGRRLPAGFYRAAVVALVGVALLTQAGGFAPPSWGDGLILVAAAVRAVHVTVIDRTTAGRDLDSARLTVVQFAVVAAVMTLVSGLSGTGPVAVARTFDGTDWLLTLYLALACTVFAFFVQVWAVRRTSPSRVSLLLGTEPLWAAGLGISLAGDPLTAATLLGGALVLLGTSLGRRQLG